MANHSTIQYLRQDHNRLPILWPNGKTVWINVKELSPYKVVSNPRAKCYPVQLKNGRYGTSSTPPK
ncbi:hypothetical protein [Commensalibacter nepenthis]|uniref:Uncharacterized protein n=1 Tax=Commensalibacter nepenthis TaxID=3043872 RepID=A0ABT6Q4E1_9PROT|nr:hypothetical protein [Commensalibacter sp. TBRC 10068]MDI2111760.1 hypothetical protein [Commensalibacter sp. TBRC 10068]